MSATALIKFVQGVSTPPAGQALIGVVSVALTASNANNADVKKWEWEWKGTPTGSAIQPGIVSSGLVPTLTVTPDVTGTYVLILRAYDANGRFDIDERAFSVLESNGLLIPSFDADSNSMNFGGQKFGWDRYLQAWLKAIASGSGLPPAVLIPAFNIDWSAGNVFYKPLAPGVNTFTFSNVPSGKAIVVRLTGAVSTVVWPLVTWPHGVTPVQTPSGTDVYTFVFDGTTIFGTVVQGGPAPGPIAAHLTADTALAALPTFTDLATLTPTGTAFLIQCHVCGAAAAATTIAIRVLIDGVENNYNGTFSTTEASGAAGFVAADLVFLVSGLTNAAHTFKLQGAFGGGAVTITAATDPTRQGAWLIATPAG